jgi:hypothetical protein
VTVRHGPLLLLLLFVFLATGTAAQELSFGEGGWLQVSNLLEFQAGRDPTLDSDELTRQFDQFILDYLQGDLRLGLRAEFYRDSIQPEFGDADYDQITQKYAEWSRPDLRIRVGNGYAILGRGLLFRAFELPGVVRDAIFPRARYAESRDLEGVIIEGRRGPLQLLALSGRPVENPDAPYGADEVLPRRDGTVSGGRLGLQLERGIVVGASYLRADGIVEPGTEDLSGVDLSLRLDPLLAALGAQGAGLSFYGEYAGRRWQPFTDGLSTRDGRPHALYTATTLAYSSWGLSFETKRYHQFDLRINDPPTLVPEISYHLLNRMTHFLLTSDEQGAQLSLQGRLPRGWTLDLEWATARNRLLRNGRYELPKDYRLLYLSLESSPMADLQLSLFGAIGKDKFEGITHHHALGLQAQQVVRDGWALVGEFEFQQAERRIATTLINEKQRYDEIFTTLGISLAGHGTLAFQAEFSNDPAEKDDPLTFDVVEDDPRAWYGGVLDLQLSDRHRVTLFAGDRRGGTACTSGTCYEVPDFSGVELRLTSRY